MLKKKIISALIAAAMSTSLFTSFAFADSTSVTIATTDNEAVTVGNTLKATVSGMSGNVAYQWYADDVAIDGATEETFVPTYNQHKKAVKCVATVDGAEVSSEAVTVTSKFKESLKYANFAWKEVGANGTADLTGDNSWEFSMTNEYGTILSFSLLDTFNNSEAKYYIMANELYDLYKTPGTIAKYDPTEQDSMAYYVNNAFTQDTPWEWNLPNAVIDTLDKDHIWVTEKEYTGSEITSHYTYTAAVTVPAVWEMDTYKARIRFKVGGGNYNYLFRTPLDDTHYHVYNATQTITRTADGETTVGIVHGNDGKWWYRLAPQGLGENTIRIRPEFFVNENFFGKAKIDLATAGEAVKKEIANVELDVLKALYTEEDLINYLGFDESDFREDSDNDEDDEDDEDVGGYFAEERTVEYTAWDNGISLDASTTTENAAKYKFSIASNGDTFSLLDVKDDNKSKYFVITDAPYATKVFVKNNNPNYFATEEGTVAYTSDDNRATQYPSWALNGNYFVKGWTFNNYSGAKKTIDATVREYIDFSHVWTCEGAPNNSIPNEQYTTTAGIIYPSASEVKTYGDRFIVNTDASFVTRTMANTGSGTDNRYIGKITPNDGKYIAVATQVQLNVRPCFWLNNQFFENVAVNLATAGEAVKKEIANVELDVLKVLYTEEDLINYLGFDESDFREDSGNDDEEFDGVYFAEERTVNYDTPWEPNSNKTITRQTADKDYVFTVKNGENDESFTLLDVDADGTNSKYFVIANQAYGKAMIFDANSDVANYWKNPTSEEKDALGNNTDSIAKKYPTYWLDGDHFEKGWLLSGATYKFGTSPLIPYIDNNHIWTCEAAPNAAVPNEKYTFTAGIALPSASEIDTYIDRLGIADVDSFATRTMINYKNGDTTYRYMGVATSNKTSWYPSHWQLPQTGSVKIRPVCWLSDQFFANVKVDLATAGAAVKQEITNVDYTALKNLYTEEELLTYLGITDADCNDFVIRDVSVQRSSEGTVSVSGKVKSNVKGETNAVVIVAVYDNEDIMVDSAATGIQMERKGIQKNFNLPINSLPDEGYTVKIMLWDDLFNANALINQYEAGGIEK